MFLGNVSTGGLLGKAYDSLMKLFTFGACDGGCLACSWLMWGATHLPSCTCWVAAHHLVALVSFATRFGRWPWAPACRRRTGSCSSVHFQGWSIPPLSILSRLSNPGGSGGCRFMPTSCSLCLGLIGSSLHPVPSPPPRSQEQSPIIRV